MPGQIVTLDFHVTSECSQDCPYCWGPQDYERPVDTEAALRIIDRVAALGIRRIVFTGGDPLKRDDVARLIRHAKASGLEVALSTTGDALTREFLRDAAADVDLISLPLDGSNEAVNARTKEPDHFGAVMRALEWLREYPDVDVKVCTPVTCHNLDDVPNILRLVERYAESTDARVFYNIFQAFPRAMFDVDWSELLVGDDEFADLERRLAGRAGVHVNFLSHATLDRLYAMVFPDGSLVVPQGDVYRSFGPFLAIDDLDAVLKASPFDAAKHQRHSRGWEKRGCRR
ncbi:MAG: radical SAM protein [Gemmatimonadetes bacterium]|uniref:Radical SAM protein n=1 Tax=Candidatus Kutchimonas denitrificans TaxID=3056748 RepID=A0AAE4Z4J7_9BACT|nr:radical SAM protein [Gemmatimonadota bacterium]NIR73644.1 radical SAM protein [Candidatus Kutchimonas denitrificans]NIR99603.1 radical SAM protein [Gemmatimonadota bacterium]NIT65223.1 radical SAM protein [Gemmatimonadota bacterium]NIV23756.1 radical SAM protein [Gemmatimonadota bacterium]